jgi:hypothetical protein
MDQTHARGATYPRWQSQDSGKAPQAPRPSLIDGHTRRVNGVAKPHVFSLADEPSGDAYARLLDICLAFADRAGLVAPTLRRVGAMSQFLGAANPFLVSVDDVFEYPGAISHYPNTRYLYRYETDLVQVLRTATDGLFAWSPPDLPEDLFLLKPDGTTLLGTVSSEDHAYLLLTNEEHHRWLSKWPASIRPQT